MRPSKICTPPSTLRDADAGTIAGSGSEGMSIEVDGDSGRGHVDTVPGIEFEILGHSVGGPGDIGSNCDMAFRNFKSA